MKSVSALALLAISPALAFAHPGHGLVESWAHYLTPEHVLPVLVAVVVIVHLFRRGKNRQ